MPDSALPAILAPGHFLGSASVSLRLPGIDIQCLVPTVGEHDVLEHAHADAHYILVVRGGYLSDAHGFDARSVHPCLIYNPPGIVHRDRFRDDALPGRAGLRCGRFMAISLRPDLLVDGAGAVRLPDHAVRASREAFDLARHLWLAMENGHPDPACAESLCFDMLGATADDAERRRRLMPPWLRRVRERLHDEHASAPPLARIAAEAGVHPVYLARAFRQQIGCSPGAYLRRCRLLHAARALARSGRPLADIALDCGFSDQAHFCREFRRGYGMTPSDYRIRARA